MIGIIALTVGIAISAHHPDQLWPAVAGFVIASWFSSQPKASDRWRRAR